MDSDWSNIQRRAYGAILFDMDGTLMDSERLSAVVLHRWLESAGVDPSDVDHGSVEGYTWGHVQATISRAYPRLKSRPIAAELVAEFDRVLAGGDVPEIPHAIRSVRQASARFPTALVTSSRWSSVEVFLKSFEVGDCFSTIVAAEDVRYHKPDPAPYLSAAKRLGVSPADCLVFEDSPPGVVSALEANMTVIKLGSQQAPPTHAVPHITDFTHLPDQFFSRLSRTSS
ncbi:MAG: HAD family phosphatase [Myxococcota bacterium]|nr:HAD family phosphatase [Myxococcota bacterium]